MIATLAASLLASACSTLTLAYNQSATLAYWWLDGLVDFQPDQVPAVKKALAETLAWHRRQKLPEIARDLDRLKDEVGRNASAEQACDWWTRAQDQRNALLDHAAPHIAAIAPGFTPAQLRHLDAKLRDRDDTWRKDHLQPDMATREREQLERLTERIERLYGELDKAQSSSLAEQLRRSPWDPQQWLADRQAHQRVALESLRALQAAKAAAPPAGEAAPPAAAAITRQWLQRIAQPGQGDSRATLADMIRHQCALAADFHNRTTAAQRQHAAEVLGGWARDARALASTR